MSNSPVIDLSLRDPRLVIADQGKLRGSLLVLWFRLVRPACVGSMWAAITLYAYRYLLPFDQGDLSWPELISYVAAIATMGAALTTWMIVAHVAHPFTSKSRMQRLLRRKAGITVEPEPFAETASRDWDADARVLVASHDSRGMIAALRAQPVAVTADGDEEERVAFPTSAYQARVTYRMGTPVPRGPRR
jgi:hypothetical protein